MRKDTESGSRVKFKEGSKEGSKEGRVEICH